MTRNGASPIIRKSTINVIGTLALRRASRIMFQKIANVLSIISFLMVSSMSVGAYLAIQYMRSPEFERTLKNKIMGDLKEKMIEEIPKQLPEFSGPSIPL
jgi:ABC-type nickel/cobalt efflux system permease component RcnA